MFELSFVNDPDDGGVMIKTGCDLSECEGVKAPVDSERAAGNLPAYRKYHDGMTVLLIIAQGIDQGAQLVVGNDGGQDGTVRCGNDGDGHGGNPIVGTTNFLPLSS